MDRLLKCDDATSQQRIQSCSTIVSGLEGQQQSQEKLYQQWHVGLLKMKPMQSYFRPTYLQVMYFMFNKLNKSRLDQLDYLADFLGELEASYDSICDIDRQTMRTNLKCMKTLDKSSKDISLLVQWSMIEAAKYSITGKLSTEIPANQYLSLLQKEFHRTFDCNEKISRQFLLHFWQILDKCLQDRLSESSIGKQTFLSEDNVEDFFQINRDNLQSWVLKNRRAIGQLGLLVDNHAECWRNLNIKLCIDLDTKFIGTNLFKTNQSIRETLKSLDTKSWQNNIRSIVLSAKQLGDEDLLLGIQSMANVRRTICDYRPIKAILNNLKGHYQVTFEQFYDSANPCEQDVIEFLNSTVELNQLDECSKHIHQLTSKNLKYLYEQYYDTRTEAKLDKSRFDEIEKWLSSWSSPAVDSSDMIDLIQPMQNHVDLAMSSLLKIISKVPKCDKIDLIRRADSIISDELKIFNLFPSRYINANLKIYNILLNCLEQNKLLIDDAHLKIMNSDYGNWNLIFRHLCDLDMIDDLKFRENSDPCIDLIHYKAAKFHINCDNIERGTELAQQLINNTKSTCVQLKTSLLLTKSYNLSEQKKIDSINDVAMKLKSSVGLDIETRVYLGLKILRKAMAILSNFTDTDEINLLDKIIDDQSQMESSSSTTKINDFDLGTNSGNAILGHYSSYLNLSSVSTNIKTMMMISKRLNEQLQSSTSDTKEKLLNQVFYFELQLLKLIASCFTDSASSKIKASALECALRILDFIKNSHDQLSRDNLVAFGSRDFIDVTKPIWLELRINLISLVCHYAIDLDDEWREQLTNVVKSIVVSQPSLFIYSAVVNRLNLQSKLIIIQGESNCDEYANAILTHQASGDYSNDSSHVDRLRKSLEFWNELYKLIECCDENNGATKWSQILVETERFLKEIRKISYLPAESLKSLTVKIPKRLFYFLDLFAKFADPKTGLVSNQHKLIELQTKLRSIYDHDIRAIKLLLKHCDRSHETKPATVYDSWFCTEFSKHLKELEYRFILLVNKRPLVYNDLEKLVHSITSLLAACREMITSFQINLRQKLYMEMISPMLSRLEPSSSILMPEYNCPSTSASTRQQLSSSTIPRPPITIHKISQTVQLIHSKTSPKKLSFIGSDGLSRSFLLKAHEDLRLDHLIMELFGTINCLLENNKITRGKKLKLRQYSVTPVSACSGLIQWIDAPSLGSFYRSWLGSRNGKKIMKELYKETCPMVCDQTVQDVNVGEKGVELQQRTSQPSSSNTTPQVATSTTTTTHQTSHENCQMPQSTQMIDSFYQLLWAYAKESDNPLSRHRPSFSNILKYRAEFDVSIFKNVIHDMMLKMPKDIVSHQLWFNSSQSHDYWLKTQQFIQSCATNSIVGYAIGLGDRHPDNILLDCNSGEVIHIDYNLCFDLAKSLLLPEKVPFRLTQCIIYAFGFAGLDGGFRNNCQKVLEVLKLHKSTILSYLSPTNLSFMIDEGATAHSEHHEQMGQSRGLVATSEFRKASKMIRHKNQVEKNQTPIDFADLCSQESIDEVGKQQSKVEKCPDITDLLVLKNEDDFRSKTLKFSSIKINNHEDGGTRATPLKSIVGGGGGGAGDQVDSVKCNQKVPLDVTSFDLQHNIKTPSKILPKNASQIYERLKDKLSGSDESIRNNQKLISGNLTTKTTPQHEKPPNQFKSSPPLGHNDGGASHSNDESISDDLIVLGTVQSTEDQVDALIVEAISMENKAKMYEGWLAWF